MKIIEHADGVYEIERFLSLVDQQQFLSITGEDGWQIMDPGNIIKPIGNNINTTIKKDIENLFSDFTKVVGIGHIRRLRDNEFMTLHKDGGSADNPQPIVFGIAIYLNDDFTGGELSYPDLNLIVKPKPRSLVVHRADYPHEVLPVTSGSRYSITTFILGNESTRFIK